MTFFDLELAGLSISCQCKQQRDGEQHLSEKMASVIGILPMMSDDAMRDAPKILLK